jgi:hypothetical protein
MTLTTADMQARIRREVAMPSRIRYTALLTAAAIMGTTIASLLATEPALPPRTKWAFAVLILIAACWAAFATWVLARRRVLYGRQRVAAARMAFTFTMLALGGSVALREHVGVWGIATTAGLALVAGSLLASARRHVAKLDAIRREIDRAGDPPGDSQ